MLKDLFLQLYLVIDRKKRLFPNGRKETLDFGSTKLVIDSLDFGGLSYKDKKSYEECASILFELTNKQNKITHFLDIGANYGFISAVFASKCPEATIIAVEPSTKLIPFLKENFALNKIENYVLLNAICGKEAKSSYKFSINPYSSQDNRVIAGKKGWETEEVNMTCINEVLNQTSELDFTFIKIDTQGFEENVFKGGEQFLSNNKNWIIKTEFAPNWLKSQGTNPVDFLCSLIELYDVAELPATIPYLTSSIDNLFIS